MKILILVMMTARGTATWAQPKKPTAPTTTTGWKVIGWNDPGMHLVDGKDCSILPPFNTFHAAPASWSPPESP
jgi:hypothetical protein